MVAISVDRARTWADAVFRTNGASPAAARATAAALIAAEADGLKGHGLSRLPTYVGMLESGKIDGDAVPVSSRPRPGVIAVDAARGFAYPALDLACEALPEIARSNGIALAGIRRSNHAGALGLYVERLADAGLVALFFANTPEAIAPWGGKKAVFGTNPIAFAAPLPDREPLVIDLALSKVARGNVVAARQAGRQIPDGWALDRDGRPTTDPEAALAGTMVAMGDAKGTALALMVEVLAAALVGAHLGFEAASFLDEKGPAPETGQTIITIDPTALGRDAFPERMQTLVAAIEGQVGARLPGTRRKEARKAAAERGIDIPQSLVDRFGAPA